MRETEDHVAVETTSVSVDPGEGIDCQLIQDFEPSTIELSEPLGNRELRGCDPFQFDDDCRAVNYRRLDPTNFGGDVPEFDEVDDPDFPPDD